ncbi:hypothetical protein ASF70_13640 [Rhizobium sp. Leaf321]|uniref:PAS domain-containing protein n=1 Tax=Rhizobium sp. Leaf321 TaxID=1736335 RepID=UPI000713C926|nr:PAS domain-containing protein [Rhizobium sp. Leaf321]KQQ72551.1 hypothetical protein ASF70_13640 [Rhizobium sp. Leaf321]
MRNPATTEIFEYWTGLCDGRLPPMRNEIDPVALRRFLPHLFIVANEADDQLTFRLAGTRLCELFGGEFRGMPFRTIWDLEENDRAQEVVMQILVHEKPAIADVVLNVAGTSIECEMLMMPLRSSETGSDRVLGALLPADCPFPVAARPASGLHLQDWGFVESDETGVLSVCGHDQPQLVQSGLLRRFLPASFFPQ